MCTFNGAQFVWEQLHSFLVQTHQPDELIVCDDNSTDETVELVERFAQEAPFRLSLRVNEERLGSTANFQQAIERCRSDIIVLSDQDDVWLPEKIERMVEAFESSSTTAMFFSDGILINEESQPIGTNLWERTFPHELQIWAHRGELFRALLWQNVVTGATVAFRSKIRDQILPFPNDIPNLIHDGWMAATVARTNSLGMIEQPLIKYRIHSRQQLGVSKAMSDSLGYEEREVFYKAKIDFHRNEKRRVEMLSQVAGFADLDVLAELRDRRDQLIRHLESRRSLPSLRLARILPVAKELRTGRYRKFSRGYLSALKDLLMQ
jgi:glycosyltransferase involved in cell wall biosynthesis